MLRIHDTLTRKQIEVTASPDGILRFYACGPTIHDFAHIGNFRTFTWVDVFRRVLLARGFRVLHVMNITDVEDKIISKAREAGIDVTDPARIPDYTSRYEKAFLDDLAALRVLPADQYPRATDVVPGMIRLIEKLLARGHAYVSDGSVYFRIATLPAYGRLSHLDESEIRAGARVDNDEYDKADARDFVLWKASKEGEPRWASPWGPGRPGWHIECSVMSMECLGAETLDVHAGGEDLVFPHHENEIAQSEGATGAPFCKLWMHGAHLRVDGAKMAKSLANFYTLRDLVGKGYDPVAIRYLLASVHYRAPLNFTLEGLEGAAKALERLNEFGRLLVSHVPKAGLDDSALVAMLKEARAQFDNCLDDDLNTSGALGVLFGVLREANTALASGALGAASRDSAKDLLLAADAIFAFLPAGGLSVSAITRDVAGSPYTVTGVGEVPVDVLEKVVGRQVARKSKDFATADALRADLTSAGWLVEDVPGGARVKKA